ncbi:hypothetical protein ACFXGT_28480 [Streptomyces sp. NPDC059352]|uniref:hypothetical protein n=1 Tax=Streptomyces sp. NPDC059352 TaxID=3346810 RepID=UPI0036D0841D
MRVRMKIKISGTRDGQGWPDRGGEIDLPDDEAEQLLRYGAAETVTEPEPDTTDEGEGEGEQEPQDTDPDPAPEEPDEETATAPNTAETRPRSRRKA